MYYFPNGFVIGITGYKGVGKTTLANAIQKEVKGSNILSFAAPVYDLANRLISYQTSMINNGNFKDNEYHFGSSVYTGRELLQLIGTEFGREIIDPEIWIKFMDNRLTPNSLTVIDDIRFVDEAELVMSKPNGWLIKLIDEDYENEDTHSSETSVQEVLNNHFGSKTFACFRNDYQGKPEELAKDILKTISLEA